MPWGYAAAAVGTYLAGQSQASAAQSAAQTSAVATDAAARLQNQAANRAIDVQQRQYAQQQAMQAPWLAAGKNALAQLSAGTTGPSAAYLKPFSMADYQADPGYAFRMKEGMKGLEQSAAARGGLLSGNTLRGIQQYGQDLASQEYQNAFNRYQVNQGNQFNRLGQLAGVGQTTATTLGSAGQTMAGNVGNIATGSVNSLSNLYMGNASTQGNAALAAGQARASTVQGLGNIFGSYMAR